MVRPTRTMRVTANTAKAQWRRGQMLYDSWVDG